MKTHTTRSKNKKKHYHIRNWKQSNQALVERGSLTFWINKDALETWVSKERTGKRGKPIVYSGAAIQTILTLQSLFRLLLWQTEGLLNSIFRLSDIMLCSPDYSTSSKRGETLSVDLARRSQERSLAETGVFRFKTIFVDRVSARKFAGQVTRLLIRCRALNQMLDLGMPDSYIVA